MLEGDSLEQGYSGGVLYVDNKPVGMLTNVDHGVGQAEFVVMPSWPL